MLQCTAFAAVPEMGALVVLTVMNTEQGRPSSVPDVPEAPDLDDMLLCELGEHDEKTEHAAQLWAGDMDAARDLWMFWTAADGRRTFRFAELPPCPAVLRTLATGEREACDLFAHHPAPHSWDVTDPLADLMAERMRREVRRARGDEEDQGGGGGREEREG